MLDYIKGLIQPLNNRYYNGTRRSLYLYIFDNFFTVALFIFLAITVNWIFWIVTFVYVTLAVIYFIYLDPHIDKFAWKHGWRRLYDSPSETKIDPKRTKK